MLYVHIVPLAVMVGWVSPSVCIQRIDPTCLHLAASLSTCICVPVLESILPALHESLENTRTEEGTSPQKVRDSNLASRHVCQHTMNSVAQLQVQDIEKQRQYRHDYMRLAESRK